MLKPSRVKVTIRPAYLLSSTIVGFARVIIDKQIMLKEITVFRSDERMIIIMPQEPIALCPEELDIDTLNKIIWQLQDVIEDYIFGVYRRNHQNPLHDQC